MRNRRLPLKAGLALAGLTYCQIFAHIEVNPFLKNYLILVPIQLGVLMYFGYAHWSDKHKQPGWRNSSDSPVNGE